MTLPVVVIGAGLAGLTVALRVADHRPVVVLAKRTRSESATAWAQGGIVGVLDPTDSVESHVQDTLAAGAGLVVESAARWVASHSHQAIQWLLALGVPFSKDATGPLGLHLTREGGHSARRIAHLQMLRERPGHTLQTSALLNEAYLRLVDQRAPRWQNRAHFFDDSGEHGELQQGVDRIGVGPGPCSGRGSETGHQPQVRTDPLDLGEPQRATSLEVGRRFEVEHRQAGAEQ